MFSEFISLLRLQLRCLRHSTKSRTSPVPASCGVIKNCVIIERWKCIDKKSSDLKHTSNPSSQQWKRIANSLYVTKKSKITTSSRRSLTLMLVRTRWIYIFFAQNPLYSWVCRLKWLIVEMENEIRYEMFPFWIVLAVVHHPNLVELSNPIFW